MPAGGADQLSKRCIAVCGLACVGSPFKNRHRSAATPPPSYSVCPDPWPNTSGIWPRGRAGIRGSLKWGAMGSVERTIIIVAIVLSPTNGGDPVSNSYRIAPMA